VSTLSALEDPREAGTLARELAAAFKGVVESFQEAHQLTASGALAKAQETLPHYQAGVLNGPADQVSWFGLQQVARHDPERAAQRWEEIKQAALDELRSGHRAAKAMEGYGSQCWARARFCALRHELMEAWQPRNGVERQLIDMLAQAQTAYLYWLEILTLRCATNSGRKPEAKSGEPLTVSDAEAEEQAAAMVDRFNRIFLRTARTLRELRRGTPGVVVQNAGQVNVGQQQVNVNAPKG
jgi:hypothetical protein